MSVHLGDLLAAATVLVGILALRADTNRRSDESKKEREGILQAQTKMHTENQIRLEGLAIFQKQQLDVNAKRDVQISELQKQTAVIAQIAEGIDRRLKLLEDR